MKKKNSFIIKYRELITYVFFGFLTTVISLFVYYILTRTIFSVNEPLQLQLSNIISWIVGVLFAYITNRKYVFMSNNKKKIVEFISFVCSRISTLLADMFIMWGGVSMLHLNDSVVKIISQIVIIVGNYLLSKYLVFK